MPGTRAAPSTRTSPARPSCSSSSASSASATTPSAIVPQSWLATPAGHRSSAAASLMTEQDPSPDVLLLVELARLRVDQRRGRRRCSNGSPNGSSTSWTWSSRATQPSSVHPAMTSDVRAPGRWWRPCSASRSSSTSGRRRPDHGAAAARGGGPRGVPRRGRRGRVQRRHLGRRGTPVRGALDLFACAGHAGAPPDPDRCSPHHRRARRRWRPSCRCRPTCATSPPRAGSRTPSHGHRPASVPATPSS